MWPLVRFPSSGFEVAFRWVRVRRSLLPQGRCERSEGGPGGDMPRILRGLLSLEIDVFVVGRRDLVRAQNLERVSNKFEDDNIYSQRPGVGRATRREKSQLTRIGYNLVWKKNLVNRLPFLRLCLSGMQFLATLYLVFHLSRHTVHRFLCIYITSLVSYSMCI